MLSEVAEGLRARLEDLLRFEPELSALLERVEVTATRQPQNSIVVTFSFTVSPPIPQPRGACCGHWAPVTGESCMGGQGAGEVLWLRGKVWYV